MENVPNIPGYTYGTEAVPRSPVTSADFALMQKSVLFDEEDVQYLRLSYDVVKDWVEDIVDVWYGFVASNPHLLAAFSSAGDGMPLGDYLGAVRKRFGQWILDTARAEYREKENVASTLWNRRFCTGSGGADGRFPCLDACTHFVQVQVEQNATSRSQKPLRPVQNDSCEKVYGSKTQ